MHSIPPLGPLLVSSWPITWSQVDENLPAEEGGGDEEEEQEREEEEGAEANL